MNRRASDQFLRFAVKAMLGMAIIGTIAVGVNSYVTVNLATDARNTADDVKKTAATVKDIQRLRAARVRDFTRADRKLCHALLPTRVIYRFVLSIPRNPNSRATPEQVAEFSRLLNSGIKAVDALHCEDLAAPAKRR